jgi:DNA invertase Pin-like site-specific DNA recombinase
MPETDRISVARKHDGNCLPSLAPSLFPFNELCVSLMSHTMKRPKRLIGYGRVSTEAQDLGQRQDLKAIGCKLLFEDRASGKSFAGRPPLAQALDELQPGDCLVLAEWDRATRSMWDGLHIVKRALEAGATIRVLDFPSLDLATPEGRGFLASFSAMAERERERIIQRTKEGRRLAMRNGVKMGPPFQIDCAPAPASDEALGGGREHAPYCARFQREPQHLCPAALKPADEHRGWLKSSHWPRGPLLLKKISWTVQIAAFAHHHAGDYAGRPAVRSASDKGSAIDAWRPAAAHIPPMV